MGSTVAGVATLIALPLLVIALVGLAAVVRRGGLSVRSPAQQESMATELVPTGGGRRRPSGSSKRRVEVPTMSMSEVHVETQDL